MTILLFLLKLLRIFSGKLDAFNFRKTASNDFVIICNNCCNLMRRLAVYYYFYPNFEKQYIQKAKLL